MMLSRLLVAAGLLLLLTWLLVQGASPDASRHDGILGALRASVLNDAAVQRDVLQARVGLLRNYDPLVEATSSLRQSVDDLRMSGEIASGPRRADIDRLVADVVAAVDDQETFVEQFKSSNALLQNSLTYFMHASRLVGPARNDDAVLAEIGTLTNAMLRLTADPGGAVAAEVTASLDRLARLPVEASRQEIVRDLDAHGRLIVATFPAVDSLVAHLLAGRTSEATKALQRVYLDAHARAAKRADFARILLYVAAVALAAYVGHLFLRLRANAHALRQRVELEHLIAAISAQFINLPRDAIDREISGGLARLAEHMAMDRAYVILAEVDRLDGGRSQSGCASFAWCRSGVDPPPWPPERLMACVMHWRLDGYRQHGCLQVPDVALIPDSEERAWLTHNHVRSWLSLPMWSAGRCVGILAFDTVRTATVWPEDDIALLRMAAEVFATTIDRQRIEAEQEKLRDRLHEAQRLEAVGTLAGGIAHEFNNILGAILGHGEIALMRLADHDAAQRHVRQIMRAGQRAQAVVDQVLAFSRRGERRHRPFAARAIVSEAIELLQASLPATVSIEADLSLGSAADDARMCGDPGQLQQVVMNLCANAAQAMDGRGTVRIGLTVTKIEHERLLSHGRLAPGDHVCVSVSDTGRGIDAAAMARLFEPFFTTRARGTGLGLATVHGIVTEHGGALMVTSAPGAGTTFEAWFPRTDARADADEDMQAPSASGHGQTILLVDDEQPLVSVGEEMLALLGYEPVGFDSSPAALTAFRADPQRFDLLLTDEVMPDMTGTELAMAVHRTRPELPIVLMTGYGGSVERRHTRSAGIRETIRKPLLSATIAQCLARHLR